MKILILIGPFTSFSHKTIGGVEKVWLTMGKKFKKLGNEIIYISKKIKKNSENELIDGILHRRIGGYSSTNNSLLRLILDLLYTIKAALILPKNIDIIKSVSNKILVPSGFCTVPTPGKSQRHTFPSL